MANECKVFEQTSPRNRNAPIRVVPFLAKQQLSSGSTSSAFNRSTTMITVVSELAGTLEFSRLNGTGGWTDPDASGSSLTFPINANQEYDFDVIAGTKVRFT